MKPACRVTLDGLDITANLIPAPFGLPLEGGGAVLARGYLSGGPLLSLTVTDNEGLKSDSVEIVVDNRDRIPAPKKGSQFKVWLGYAETGLVYMGSYQVDTWSKSGRPLKLQISAKAVGLTTEIKSPKSRSYHKTNVGEIVEKVAGKNSLGSKVHPELSKVKIGHIDQSNESDLHFLTRLAKRIGGNFKLADGQIIMNKAGAGTLPSGSQAPVFDIPETGTLEWSGSGSERGSYGSSSAAWHDTEEGERKTVVVGEGKPRYRDRKLYKTEDEARQAAQAVLSGLNRGKRSFNVSLPGKPEIFAGARMNATEYDPDVDGLYGIKSAVHTLDSGGLKTSLTGEGVDEKGGSNEGGDEAGGDDSPSNGDGGGGEGGE